MIIGIDFDGTCVEHKFPLVGEDIGAVPVLRELVNAGHKLILFTMRSDIDKIDITKFPELKDALPGPYLTEAVNWFAANQIPLYGIQENPGQKSWTLSPKAYCHLYIDDAALGIPLIYPKNLKDRAYVDWKAVRKLLKKRNLI